MSQKRIFQRTKITVITANRVNIIIMSKRHIIIYKPRKKGHVRERAGIEKARRLYNQKIATVTDIYLIIGCPKRNTMITFLHTRIKF